MYYKHFTDTKCSRYDFFNVNIIASYLIKRSPKYAGKITIKHLSCVLTQSLS